MKSNSKAGPVILKPKLWNRLILQTPLKPSKSLKTTTGEEPSRTELVRLHESVTNDLNWCISDSGLFNSRRFRSCWSLSSAGYAFSRLGVSQPQSFAAAVHMYTVHFNPTPDRAEIVRKNCEMYLGVELELTEFCRANKLALPLLKPKKGNELIRRCFECTQQIRNSIGNGIQKPYLKSRQMITNS